jgi:hypothetical protein
MATELLTSTKSSVVKATTVTFLDDVQLPVLPASQHMPIYLPPKEFNAVNSGLPPTIASLNVVSTREADPPPRRETVRNIIHSTFDTYRFICPKVKSSIPDVPLPHVAENVSKPREVCSLHHEGSG